MENRNLLKKYVIEVIMIVFGTAMMAINYYFFMEPNDIMAPGLGGIAIILSEFIPLTLGGIYFILNIPLFLMGFRFVGWNFVLYSFCGMVCLSLFLFLFESLPSFQQPLIGGVIGGILNGAFLAIILKVGGSTGGLDIAFVVIHKFWPRFTIGSIMFTINAVVIIVSGIIFGFSSFLYTMISIYLAGKALDLILQYGKKQSVKEGVSIS